MSAGTRRRLVPRLRLPRLRPRLFGAILLVAAVLVGAFFWVRQSSLVAVQRVTVTGVSGPDAVVIRQTLVRTAERMTTMTMSVQRLRAAVARYPVVRSLRVSTHLPHSATITVFEQVPVGVLDGTTVSARGTLLRDVNPSRTLPRITAASGPTAPSAGGGAAVTGTARADIYLLASAPYPIISRLATAGWKPGRGLTVAVRNGPVIYFGNDTRLVEKWRSVIRVLADPSSAGASYIDVTDPTRPAAGTGADTQSTEPSSSSSALTGTTPQPAATTPQSTATTGVPGG
jgi:cell division protein FtsQ